MCRQEESTRLLNKNGGSNKDNASSSSSTLKKESDYTGDNFNRPWSRRVVDIAIGFGLCALIAVGMSMSRSHDQPQPQPVDQHYEYSQQQQQQREENNDRIPPPHSISSSSSSSSSIDAAPHRKHNRPTNLRANSREDSRDNDSKTSSSTSWTGPSKYTRFQAMGFQIYTGGAPALIVNHTATSSSGSDSETQQEPTLIHNPECNGLNSYGHFDDYDVTNDTLPSSLWQCYLGHDDWYQDVQHRLRIMTAAVERAYKEAANDDPTILKIFIAPEFFWRGREGAYIFGVDPLKPKKKTTDDDAKRGGKMLDDDECTEVCQIMMGLEQIVSQKKYKDWLFLFGTVVASETLPNDDDDDDFDYLFYNFAPIYKGYDPETEDHYGKRFLVPKRYVSNVDFLTPVRQYNGPMLKELVELTEQQMDLARQRQQQIDHEDNNNNMDGSIDDDASFVRTQVTPTKENEPIVVQNPFEMQRDFYDHDMWYDYKDQLTAYGYTMIEYDWLILDNITFTIEVCLDHDAKTALNAYLADSVLGSPSRIPKSVVHWDDVAQKYVGSVEQVRIPRRQAQISLVSSMGMVANPNSLALCQNGTLILQDGQSDKNGSMAYTGTPGCDIKSWHFDGGTEFISRTTAITTTRIDFSYQIHVPNNQVGVFDDLYNDADDAWKQAVQGVFTTTKYEPKITIYPIRDIAKV